MSWFKTFNKKTWELRVFRSVNLKFLHDEIGGTKAMYQNWWKDAVWKVFRTHEAARSFNIWFILALGLAYGNATARETTPEEIEAARVAREKLLQEEEEIKNRMFVNRFGANTQPLRSIEELLEFITTETLLDNTMDYVGHPDASENTDDYQKGLDSWMSDEDRKMVQYFQRRKNSGH